MISTVDIGSMPFVLATSTDGAVDVTERNDNTAAVLR